MVLSTDAGQSWRPIGIPAMLTRIHCVAFSADGTLWLGAREGVYFTRDLGKTWLWVNRFPLDDVDDLNYDAQLGQGSGQLADSDQVYAIDPKTLEWKWWQTGYRIDLVRAAGGRLLAASLYDGVLVEPQEAGTGNQGAEMSGLATDGSGHRISVSLKICRPRQRLPATPAAFRTHDPRLEPIAAKVLAGERLDFNDGLALYGSPDVLAVGWLANHVRERMHGDVTYFNVNRHINPTNVCVAACKLCAFGRKKGDPAGYTMALEEAWETAASGYSEAVTEFHIVGGLHPDLPLEYFLDLVRGLKERFPKVHIKAFTMVEVAYLARRAKLTIEQTLIKLREAGVDSMPGGGAEIFAARVRSIICDHKIDGEEWLETARLAHKLGFKSNATMLYGHIENDEDRVDHLLKLRALQDETGGFQTFIPLAFHPENTPLDHLPVTTGLTDIRQIAVSRLLLDNFPHIKAYWQMMTPKIAQIALRFGADDLDGTVIEEKIYHDAGATTPQGMTRKELCRLITEAGRVPVERDTLYHAVTRTEDSFTVAV